MIVKVLQRLVKRYKLPEYIFKLSTIDGWQYSADHTNGWELLINFNSSKVVNGGVSVEITRDGVESLHLVEWANPECDVIIINLLKNWIHDVWEGTYLDTVGYPNPLSDEAHSKT
jgi:hypothetical protein